MFAMPEKERKSKEKEISIMNILSPWMFGCQLSELLHGFRFSRVDTGLQYVLQNQTQERRKTFRNHEKKTKLHTGQLQMP